MMSAKRAALKTGGERIAGVKLFVLRQVTSNQHGDEVGATLSDAMFNQERRQPVKLPKCTATSYYC